MPNGETIHILDNFTRQKIYNLYKDYVQCGQGNGNFIKYAYFTIVRKKSSTMSAFQRGQGWGSTVHVLLLKKEEIDQRDRKRYVYKIIFLDKCRL